MYIPIFRKVDHVPSMFFQLFFPRIILQFTGIVFMLHQIFNDQQMRCCSRKESLNLIFDVPCIIIKTPALFASTKENTSPIERKVHTARNYRNFNAASNIKAVKRSFQCSRINMSYYSNLQLRVQLSVLQRCKEISPELL